MKRAGKTIECFNDIRKYLSEGKVRALAYMRDGKTEILYTQMYIDEKDKEIERLNNIINELEKYTIENIEVLENRLNSPFCNFEKATKELSIFQNYLDKLKELKESSNYES